MSPSKDLAPVEPRTDHAWMPSSPCGTGCIGRDSATVMRVTVLLRILVAIIAFGLLPILILVGLASPRARHGVTRFGARLLLFAVGIDLRVSDLRSDRERSRTDAGALFVAAHVSWTDVLVLTALRPATFVARGDLIDWPVLGLLARAMKVLPIDRANLRALPGTVEQVSRRLDSGSAVVAFPEATTWCGRAYGSFRPAMFQAAIDTETWVQPVRLRYTDADDGLTTATCFVGEETIGQSISRIFRLKGITAQVELPAPEPPGNDRRDLASRCELSARAGETHDPSMHAVALDDAVRAPELHIGR
ncbi:MULTISPECIES: lysophospholipid acyltransferase family protein [Nocardiaceae]|jgi:1-acyl-sn-glycerol-3-phosphate acyltransferase|uniref:lysophospholipid acyltransferase family protein n=1 Tax=Nocardiaceae TaxID=85025 RepID=UPI001E4227D0|nr:MULTISPECIES: lysophospholipid acyltransferase family protein [Rhodococcus]MCC8926458.1 1-acyl-sn-glycerol-3-phosphate acyltransferase [Rhodococcus sp. I2R]MCZ4274289.1 lysophospholipid acyltransferase family protein [Rhodococcus yunnanensis]